MPRHNRTVDRICWYTVHGKRYTKLLQFFSLSSSFLDAVFPDVLEAERKRVRHPPGWNVFRHSDEGNRGGIAAAASGRLGDAFSHARKLLLQHAATLAQPPSTVNVRSP